MTPDLNFSFVNWWQSGSFTPLRSEKSIENDSDSRDCRVSPGGIIQAKMASEKTSDQRPASKPSKRTAVAMRNLSPEDFTLLWAGIEGYVMVQRKAKRAPASQETSRNQVVAQRR
jgi:hypothetical protein